MGNTLDCSVNSTALLFGNASANATNEPTEQELAAQGNYLWLVGVGATLVSALAVSLGSILQKLAHNVNQAKPAEERSREFMGLLWNPVWLLGLSMMVLLQLPLSLVSLTLARQSLIIPLGAGTTIVFNQLLAPCILKEELTAVEIFATFVILVGVSLSTTAGAGANLDFPVCVLLARYSEVDFYAPSLVLVAFIVLALSLIHCSKEDTRPAFLRSLMPALYGFVAGGMGALMNILLKATGEFGQAVIEGTAHATWTTIHPYYHIVLVVLLALAMISYINQGLAQFNAVVYLPLYNCIYILLSSSFGALFFREFDDYNTLSWIMFPTGIVITIGGIALMSATGAKLRAMAAQGRARIADGLAKPRHLAQSISSTVSHGGAAGARVVQNSIGTITKRFSSDSRHGGAFAANAGADSAAASSDRGSKGSKSSKSSKDSKSLMVQTTNSIAEGLEDFDERAEDAESNSADEASQLMEQNGEDGGGGDPAVDRSFSGTPTSASSDSPEGV